MAIRKNNVLLNTNSRQAGEPLHSKFLQDKKQLTFMKESFMALEESIDHIQERRGSQTLPILSFFRSKGVKMRYFIIAVALAFSACSGGNDTVLPAGNPEVSAALRQRKAPRILPILKGDKKLEFVTTKERGDMPVPEGPNYIKIDKIIFGEWLVTLKGRSVETGDPKTFEIIINQSKLIKEGEVAIKEQDSVEISYIVRDGKRRYYVSINYTQRLSLAKWVDK